MDRPKYILIAGVNGAGKSSLYHLQPNIVKNTKRINADEILQRNHGDWHNQMDNFRAMRDELTEIKSALINQESIHIETILAGNGKTHLELINQAKANGYCIILIYVTLNSAKIAITRVAQRVAKGGHGIAPSLIRTRFDQSLKNMPRIAAQSDHVILYDNTQQLTLTYDRLDAKIVYDIRQRYPWLKDLGIPDTL